MRGCFFLTEFLSQAKKSENIKNKFLIRETVLASFH